MPLQGVVVGALAVYVDGVRRYLVGQRKGPKFAGCWEFPGGKVEPGETDAQAMQREWREELGIYVRLASASLTFVDFGPPVIDPPCRIRLYGLWTPKSTFPFITEETEFEAHTAIAWRSLGDLNQLPDAELTPSMRPFIECLFKHEREWADRERHG